jgi:hypothetical protein
MEIGFETAKKALGARLMDLFRLDFSSAMFRGLITQVKDGNMRRADKFHVLRG